MSECNYDALEHELTGGTFAELDDEQPAPDAGEWHYNYNDFDQHGGTCDRFHVREAGNGDCIAHTATKRAAATIVRDHALATLVPGLVEALDDMLDLWKRSQKVLYSGRQRDIEGDSQVVAARTALNAARKAGIE